MTNQETLIEETDEEATRCDGGDYFSEGCDGDGDEDEIQYVPTWCASAARAANNCDLRCHDCGGCGYMIEMPCCGGCASAIRADQDDRAKRNGW